MSNVSNGKKVTMENLKLPWKKNLTFSHLRFKKFVPGLVFGELKLTQISLNFQNSWCNLKVRVCVDFLLF